MPCNCENILLTISLKKTDISRPCYSVPFPLGLSLIDLLWFHLAMRLGLYSVSLPVQSAWKSSFGWLQFYFSWCQLQQYWHVAMLDHQTQTIWLDYLKIDCFTGAKLVPIQFCWPIWILVAKHLKTWTVTMANFF